MVFERIWFQTRVISYFRRRPRWRRTIFFSGPEEAAFDIILPSFPSITKRLVKMAQKIFLIHCP